MDWAKAKTILIIALIITDIFLLYNYVSSHRGGGEIDNTEMLISVLEESGISVTDIPDEHSDMPALQVRHIEPVDEEVKSLIESAGIRVDNSDKDNLEDAYIEAASDFVEYLGMMSDYAVPEYVVLSDTGRNNSFPHADREVVFRCVRNNYELSGSNMICVFDDGELTGFESNWFEPVEFSGSKLPTISASFALISYMTDKPENEEVTIEEMEMVYWVREDSYEGESVIADTALPAWKMTLADGREIFIDAIELIQ